MQSNTLFIFDSIRLSYWLVFLLWFCLGDIIDSVKVAAEGVKNHSSVVATWMKNTVSPTLKNMLPASPGPPPDGVSQPASASTSSAAAAAWTGRRVREQFECNTLTL